MTAAENIAFVARGSKQEKALCVQENLQRFGLADLKEAYPHELSGGQQQRLALARIMAADNELLLLDEPFSALDSYLKWQLEMELSGLLAAYGGAAVFVSHDRGEVYRLADRVAVISQGQLEAVHAKRALFKQPDTLTATLLTGCKNVSAARKTGAQKIYALDWQLELVTEAPVADNVQFAGIRAHFFALRQTAGINTFAMEVVSVVEDVFSYLVMLRRKGSEARPVRLELSKADWQALGNPTEVQLYFPPDKIMLLER